MILSRICFRISMSSHASYLNLDKQKTMKHCHPAAERNKQPIKETLTNYIDGNTPATLLEVSSGSGQHVAHIAPSFPKVIFQPTEVEKSSLKSIGEYAKESSNIKTPKYLDVRTPPQNWLDGSIGKESLDYILNINMIHISEWACAQGLFAGCKEFLKPGGKLFTYGPYADNGVIEPQSNIDFDASLRKQDSRWGLRDITKEVVPLAASAALTLTNVHQLPANNKLLVWIKNS